MCRWHSAKAPPPHLASWGPAQSASSCQHPRPSALCQRLTFEQRATVSDVVSLVICAEFPVSCPNTRRWHRLPLWGHFFWHECCWGAASSVVQPRRCSLGLPLLSFLWALDTSPWDSPEEALRGENHVFYKAIHATNEPVCALRWNWSNLCKLGLNLIWPEGGGWLGFLGC